MSRRQTPQPVQTPFDRTSTVPDTPDIEAYRAFAPSTALLEPAVNAQFANAERDVNDQYAAYSGIPSQVARNRLQGMAKGDLAAAKSVAMAQGNTEAQRLKMAQLESLAGLTRGGRETGYNTQLYQPQPSGLLNSIIGGGASVGAAAILA